MTDPAITDELFPGFTTERIATRGAEIFLRRGGSGPPVLMLHGYPQTHAMWHQIAPALARRFSLVLPDSRGYGRSSKPPGGADHSAYAKRAMAQDMVEVMAALGFKTFAVVGHDRGARVGYRLALDHPAQVTRLAVMDIVPTHTMWSRMNKALANAAFHWTFLAQPFDLPERLIGADPAYFLTALVRRWAAKPEAIDPRAMAEYLRAFSDPACIHASCEDYRAGATLDDAHDEADFGRRKIACPVLALWGESGFGKRSGDALEVWRQWAGQVSGHSLPCGHFVAEEAPAETLAALERFL